MRDVVVEARTNVSTLVSRRSDSSSIARFVKKLSDRDQMQLELANDSVHSSTEKVREGGNTGKRME